MKKKIQKRRCYMCGVIYKPGKGRSMLCSQECLHKNERSYASECYGFNNKLTV